MTASLRQPLSLPRRAAPRLLLAGCALAALAACSNMDADLRGFGKLGFRDLRGQNFLGLGECAGIGETNFDRIAGTADAGVTDILVTQMSARSDHHALQALVDDAFHVHLEQEVDAAPQVETQIHRQGIDVLQPFRRVRQQVERHDV